MLVGEAELGYNDFFSLHFNFTCSFSIKPPFNTRVKATNFVKARLLYCFEVIDDFILIKKRTKSFMFLKAFLGASV